MDFVHGIAIHLANGNAIYLANGNAIYLANVLVCDIYIYIYMS